MLTATEYLLVFAGGLISYLIYDWLQVSRGTLGTYAVQTAEQNKHVGCTVIANVIIANMFTLCNVVAMTHRSHQSLTNSEFDDMSDIVVLTRTTKAKC